MWVVSVGDLVSGKMRFPQIDCSGWSWERALNRVTGGSFTIPVRDLGLSREMVRVLKRKYSTVFFVEWYDENAGDSVPENVIVFAGLVTDVEWNPADGVLTVNTATLRTMLERRFLAGLRVRLSGPFVTANPLSPSESIAEHVGWAIGSSYRVGNSAAHGSARVNNPAYSLPVIIKPATDNRPKQNFSNYLQRDLAEDRIRSLQDAYPDTDLDFVPRFLGKDDRKPHWYKDEDFGWDVWVGRENDNPSPYFTQTSAYTLPSSPGETRELSLVSVREDGTRRATGLLVNGQGSGANRLTKIIGRDRVPELRNIDTPYLDRNITFSTVEDEKQLDISGVAELRERAKDTVQYSFEVRLDSTNPGRFMPGMKLKVYTPEDEFMDAGEHTFRVISVSGGTSKALSIEVQEVG